MIGAAYFGVMGAVVLGARYVFKELLPFRVTAEIVGAVAAFLAGWIGATIYLTRQEGRSLSGGARRHKGADQPLGLDGDLLPPPRTRQGSGNRINLPR